MPPFKFTLLGAPQLEMDGGTVSLDTRKAIALLAYVVMNAAQGGATAHTRDALAALLWPDLDQSRARAALRRTLSPLRQAVDQRILDVTRDTIGLNANPHEGAALWVDAIEFQQLLNQAAAHEHGGASACSDCRAWLEQAVALYRDDFMSGFSLRDAPDFDEWQYFEGERLRRALAAALEQLIRLYAAQGDYERAIALTRRHLALDPLSEQAHRSLMQLYAWSGQRSMAVRQYRECVRILEQELGVAPLEETTALYERILGNDLPPPQPHTPVPAVASHLPPAMPARPATPALPLVGRDDAWRQMRAAHERARSGGHLLVVEGEAGVGKTRLVEEFLDQIAAVTVRARCYEGENNLAYAPFIGALRQALDHAPASWRAEVPAHRLAEAARLLPEIAPDGARPETLSAEHMSGPGAQSRFFEAISQVLLAFTAAAGSRQETPLPGILFFDDIHWADQASLELLAFLVKRLARHPLLVLVTWRPESLPAARHLQLLLGDAQRNGNATRLTLQRLSENDVEALFDRVQDAGYELPRPWRRVLYQETEGLPFFVAEYIKSALEGAQPPAGTLASDEIGPFGDPSTHIRYDIPPGVRALLQSRLDGVDEIGRQLLNTAAVIGRSFHFDTCRLASGRSEEEAVAALEELLARGIIEEMNRAGERLPAPLYDFSHNQIRALVYHETSLVRRRLLHRRVAETLAQHATDGAQAAQIARHHLLAGQEANAAAYFWRAGEHAREIYANAAALSHLRTALALGHPQLAELHEAIGDLHTLLGDYEQAVSSYEMATARAAANAQARLEHKLGNVYDRRGEWQRAESHFQVALAAPQQEPQSRAAAEDLQARIYADWSLTAHHQGDDENARQLAQKARELAQKSNDHAALVQVHNILGILARHAADLPQAQEHLQKSLSLATAAGHPSERIAALNNLALVYVDARQLAVAQRTFEEALQLCQELGDRHREAALLNNLADLHHAARRSGEAMAHLKRAAAIFAEIGGQQQEWQPEIWKLSEW